MKLASRMTALGVLCAFLAGCTKEEDSFKNTDALAGTWKWEKTLIHNTQTVYPNPGDNYYLRFSKEGSFAFLLDSAVLRSGTYTARGEQTYQNVGPGKLNLKLSDDRGEYLVTLNGMEMILEYDSPFGNPTSAYYQRQ
ncbi:hypothetical protein [Terrimonas ferruginea]|uniref:hypothetical protein n=1 Tax=Terrimonas ferruginea TaxID=249 RepID=UPI0012DC767F|nr:hypothetical protein [Terrimonas ferruginea]